MRLIKIYWHFLTSLVKTECAVPAATELVKTGESAGLFTRAGQHKTYRNVIKSRNFWLQLFW